LTRSPLRLGETLRKRVIMTELRFRRGRESMPLRSRAEKELLPSINSIRNRKAKKKLSSNIPWT
jgi:hypothetical protein